MKRVATLAKTKKMRKIWLLGFALLMVGLGGSSAFALDTMGPPAAELLYGQFRGGVDYSYSSMDIKLIEGKWTEYFNSVYLDSGESLPLTLKDFEIHKAYASLGYGIAENWEVFLRMGGTNAEFGDSIWRNSEKFDGSIDFAIGAGIKATFFEGDDLTIGGLFQANWSEFDGKLETPQWAAPDFVGIELMEMQVALGITRTWTDRVSVYGGPFAHFIYGELDDTFSAVSGTGLLTSEFSWNIDKGPIYGGYIGARIKISEDCSFNVEYQQSADANAFGASLMLRY